MSSKSSKIWLARQFRDPYIRSRMASPVQYRSRSAFKLLEMDAKYKFLRPKRSRLIVDLGAAPGGWSQVLALNSGYINPIKGQDPLKPSDDTNYGLTSTARIERRGMWSDTATTDPTLPHPLHTMDESNPEDPEDQPVKIIALDLQRMRPIRGVTFIQTDFLSSTAAELLRAQFPKESADNPVDVLLSDMAANASGNPVVDSENSLRICQAVWTFAERHLSSGGVMVLKHFVHPDTQRFRKTILEKAFKRVIHVKPLSSRSESAEAYWICIGWLGPDASSKVGPHRNRQRPPALPVDPPFAINSLTNYH